MELSAEELHAAVHAYVAFTHVHPPEQAHPDFDQTSPERNGMYADIIAEMDHRIGQILDALHEAQLADDTIVVFSSDNGFRTPSSARTE